MSAYFSNTEPLPNSGSDTENRQIREVVFNGYTENYAYFLFADGTVHMIDRYTEKAITDKAEILRRWNRLDSVFRKHLQV